MIDMTHVLASGLVATGVIPSLFKCNHFSAMVQNKGIDELRVEKVMELVHITATKNSVTRNISIMVLGGIQERTPTLTSRGFVEEDFMKVLILLIYTSRILLYFMAF